MKIFNFVIVLLYIFVGCWGFFIFGRWLFMGKATLKPIPESQWITPTSTPSGMNGNYTIPPATNVVPPKYQQQTCYKFMDSEVCQ